MGWEILIFISAYVLYKWFGNPNYIATDSWFQREDEIRTNKWIVVAATAFVSLIYGLYYLLNEWFGMSLGVYLLILLSIPFLLYWFCYKNP